MESVHYPDSLAQALAASPSGRTHNWLGAGLIAVLAVLMPLQADAQDTSSPRASTFTGIAPNNPMAASNVLIRAIGLVGTPYRWGGNTPESGFDCSGLVAYVFRDMVNLSLPRNSRELAVWQASQIAMDQLRSGDLVFFGNDGAISHVGIYVGDGRFVHAPSTGGTVRLDRLDQPYWQARYAGARRVLPKT